MSEGLVGKCILASRLTLAFCCRKGRLGYGCPSTRSSGVDGKNLAPRLTGLVEMIRGLANPKSGGARQEVHSRPVNIGGSGGQGPAEMPGAG